MAPKENINDHRLFPGEREIDLRRYVSIFFQKRWIFFSILSIVMTITLIQTFKETPIYRATATILIESPVGSLSLSETQRVKVSPQIGGKEYYQTQYALLKSDMLAKRVCKALNLPFPAARLQEIIGVEPIRNTRLVAVSADNEDPVIATKIANTLVGAYIEQNIEGMLFMSKEVLKAFPSEAGEIEKHTVYGQLKELSREDVLESLPPLAQDPVLRGLKSEKISIETKLANLGKTYKDKHPKVASLKAELKFIDDKIDIETDRILRSVKEDLAGRLQANNIRVIDYAEVPKKPIKPQKAKNILYGLFVSALLGIGTIVFTEYLDNTIKNQEDVEGKLNMPYLGYFPEIRNTDMKLLSTPCDFNVIDKNMELSTPIRNIRTNVLFSAPSDRLKSILLTSTLPQEGKSFVAAYLAYALAKGGSSTLLIDCDIRKSRLHKIFDIARTPGLTNLLVEDLDIDAVIRKTGYENLYILPAGSTSPNPLELLSSEKMKKLMGEFGARFEKIVIDSPPSFMLSDSFVLSKFTDATLLLLKSGMIGSDALHKIINKFKASDIRLIGIIINFFHVERHSYYYKDKYYHKYYKSYYSSTESESASTESENSLKSRV